MHSYDRFHHTADNPVPSALHIQLLHTELSQITKDLPDVLLRTWWHYLLHLRPQESETGVYPHHRPIPTENMDFQALQIRIPARMPRHLPHALENGSYLLESWRKLIQVLHHDRVQHSLLQSGRSALLGQKSNHWLPLAHYPHLLSENPVTDPSQTLNEKRTDAYHFSEHFPANSWSHPFISTSREGLFIFRTVQQLLSLSSSLNNQKLQLSHYVSLHSSLPPEDKESVPYAFTHGEKLWPDKDNERFSVITVIFRHIFKVLDTLGRSRWK